MTTSAKGLSAGVKTYSGNEALTFTLKQKQGGKLRTKIKLTFTPKSGKHQTKTLAVRFQEVSRSRGGVGGSGKGIGAA